MIKWLKKVEKKRAVARRFEKTLKFVGESLPPPSRIFDLGTPNDLSRFLQTQGYDVSNTNGEDLDVDPECIAREGYEATTAFEILEHLVNPMGVLLEIKSPKLFATVPLTLWFSKAYRSKRDPWDRHFHEFEDWQFDWLLEKAGWKVVRRQKWTNPSIIPGIRPLLRSITPRYYAVEAERN